MMAEHTRKSRFGGVFAKRKPRDVEEDEKDDGSGPPKWSMGVLNDKQTIEVPGTSLLATYASVMSELTWYRICPLACQ
jgi:hypothetical protein